MSRIGAVIKREFTESVATKTFLIATILGPVFIFGIFGLQFLIISKSGGGEQHIAIIDATGRGLGERVAGMLATGVPRRGPGASPDYRTEVVTATAANETQTRQSLAQRVTADQLDGFLWIPAGALDTATVQYEGDNATNSRVTGDLRNAVQQVVQAERLTDAGIDQARLGQALQPIAFEAMKTGANGAVGNPAAAAILAFAMAFAIYMGVILYGQAVMNGVLEEKRDRIVELVVSSIRPRDLLFGKITGIGAAGLLQMAIWVACAALLITKGGQIASALGASSDMVAALSNSSMIPDVPLSVGLAFLAYFAGGFFLYATLYAVLGSIVTNTQEAQQLVFPILLPFIAGLFIAMSAVENPESTLSVAGSYIPITSPMVMPVRIAIGGVRWLDFGISIVLLAATALAIVWVAGKIYKIGIFATGKRASMRDVVRWIRTA